MTTNIESSFELEPLLSWHKCQCLILLKKTLMILAKGLDRCIDNGGGGGGDWKGGERRGWIWKEKRKGWAPIKRGEGRNTGEVWSIRLHSPPLPSSSLSQSMWQEDLCNTPEMEGGDGERVTRRRMKGGARRAAVKEVGGEKRSDAKKKGRLVER